MPVDNRIERWFNQHADSSWGRDPRHLDLEFAGRVAERIGALYGENSWFGLSVNGWENLPDRPSLLVSNHSGGTTIPDMWGLMVAWYRQFGIRRVVHPMAHDMIFLLPALAESFARLGVLRGAREIAERVLTEHQRDVLVCPGGDRDTWRPWRDRYRVNFAGRKGYARIALRSGVPIVPVANAGAHSTFIVLTDGARVARKLRLPELFRAEIFPVHLSVPWGLGVGPMPHLPMPSHLRYRIGTPIFPPIPSPVGQEPSAEAVEAYDTVVRAAVQGLLDQLKEEEVPPGKRAVNAAKRMRDRVKKRGG